MKPKYKYTHAPRNFIPTLSRFLVILVIILFLSLYPAQTLSKVKVKKKKNHAPKLILIYVLKKYVLIQQISAYSLKYSLK